ncbi:hypothetical protein [Brevundimonas aurifodinae]|uniref:Uncharacterized protein n=1 Tax=Brevundimonas aurifodinae TaxID=1508312 RepID=A0ABV1NK50_9CAUL
MQADRLVTQTAVVRCGGGKCHLFNNRQDRGHFYDSVDTIEAALLRAVGLLEEGVLVEVLVQGPSGQLRHVDPVRGDVIG